MELDAVLLS